MISIFISQHIAKLQTQLQQMSDLKDLEFKKINTVNKNLQDRLDQSTKEIYAVNEKYL